LRQRSDWDLSCDKAPDRHELQDVTIKYGQILKPNIPQKQACLLGANAAPNPDKLSSGKIRIDVTGKQLTEASTTEVNHLRRLSELPCTQEGKRKTSIRRQLRGDHPPCQGIGNAGLKELQVSGMPGYPEQTCRVEQLERQGCLLEGDDAAQDA